MMSFKNFYYTENHEKTNILQENAFIELLDVFSSCTKLAACKSPEGSPVTIYNFN